MQSSVPVVDNENPCYCPSLTAVAFLDTLRNRIHADPPPYSASHEDALLSFSRRLDQSLDEADLYQFLYRNLSSSHNGLHHSESSGFDSTLSLPLYGHSTPAPGYTRRRQSPPKIGVKKTVGARKRSQSCETFSSLVGPPRRERSSQSVNDGSFELSGKAERLNYFRHTTDIFYSPYMRPDIHETNAPLTNAELENRIRLLEDELYGPPMGAETPRGTAGLVSRLDALLPGIRLKKRLYALGAVTHQQIVDTLAVDGYLNARILNMFRMSEIDHLDLTASIMDEEGLNLAACELLQIFDKPNSFLFLSELSLSNASLQDFDITRIHHLPRLSRLWLSNTGIGNEAVYHLIALRRTLSELDLALNSAVDDDAIPALLSLTKLRFLSIFDTSVRMSGLRHLATTLRDRKDERSIDIEAPRECEEYLHSMHSKYMLHPQSPLIIDPEACMQLSPAALHRNLSEHAAFNPDISLSGSKAEMAERLERILKMREMDLAVRDLVWKNIDKEVDQDAETLDSLHVF